MPEAGRVIAGTAGGRRLLAPGPGTRPLADRVKQTLFAVLEPDIAGAAVLDLFAGSGAAGIEALSRGATRVAFVERDPTAVRTIGENLRRTGFRDRPDVEVVRAEVLAWLAERVAGDEAAQRPFGIAIVDPPYAETALLRTVLEQLGGAASAILAPDARVVAKHFWRDAPPERIGLLASERRKRFGETALTFYRREAGPKEAQ
jgi:16S rRNA (guanine(966)-N(2))-methyltransferase RsmD